VDIANVIDITINVASPAVSRIGFGTPLIYSYSLIVPASEMVREYSTSTGLADMVTDGFNVDDPAYLAATAIASQSPRPRTFKVARGTQAFDFDTNLTMLTDTVGETIDITITGEDPAVANTLISQTYNRTCLGGGVPAEATAVAGLITAGLWGAAGDITAVAAVNDVQIRAQAAYANKMLYYSSVNNVSIADVTAFRTPQTDLAAIIAADPDWYMLICPDAGTLDISTVTTGIAAWVQGQTNKMGCFQTQDSVVWAGTGIGDTLRGRNYTRSALVGSKHSMQEMPSAAYAGRFLPESPGTEVWAFKPLTGVTPSALTTAESGFAHADFVNTIEGITIGGQTVVTNQVFKGWTSGSSETFIDTIRLVDALVAEVQIRLLSLFTASRKVPYNDSGIGQVKAGILAAIRSFEGDNAGLLPGSAFCDVPLRADVAAADIAARELNNVVFGATLNGAVMKVTISATLSY